MIVEVWVSASNGSCRLMPPQELLLVAVELTVYVGNDWQQNFPTRPQTSETAR